MLKNCFFALVVMIAFVQCSGTPLPPDRANYEGRWQSTEMKLTITKDGRVDYKRMSGGTSTSVNGPIKEFIGDDFVVGVLFITTTFKVNKKPYQQDGRWKMVVDGVELTKVRAHEAF